MNDHGQPDYSDLAEIDRLIHESARMAIMAALPGCESADLGFFC